MYRKFIFLILISFSSFADECGPDINLTEKGQCLGNYPPLSQGNTSNCWAFATATLADAHLRCTNKMSLSSRISPWPIALGENEHQIFENNINLEASQCPGQSLSCYEKGAPQIEILTARSGNIINNGASISAGDKILRKKMNGEVCDHYKLGLTDVKGAQEFFSSLREIYESKNFEMGVFTRARKECMKEQKEYDESWWTTKTFLDFMEITPENNVHCIRMKEYYSEIVTALNQSIDSKCSISTNLDKELITWTKSLINDVANWELQNADTFVNNWIQKRCAAKGATSRIQLPPLKQVSGSDQNIKTIIEAQLNKGKPIGVEICAKVLLKPDLNSSGIYQRGPNYACSKKTCDCSPHALVVVGRKKVGNGCTYILRNSWGTGCDGYNPGYVKAGLCDPTNGNILVPERLLLKDTINTAFYD
jgi:Papain family cysteine protease